jgi:hypothetical protein
MHATHAMSEPHAINIQAAVQASGGTLMLARANRRSHEISRLKTRGLAWLREMHCMMWGHKSPDKIYQLVAPHCAARCRRTRKMPSSSQSAAAVVTPSPDDLTPGAVSMVTPLHTQRGYQVISGWWVRQADLWISDWKHYEHGNELFEFRFYIPPKAFNAADADHMSACWHYTNLQLVPRVALFQGSHMTTTPPWIVPMELSRRMVYQWMEHVVPQDQTSFLRPWIYERHAWSSLTRYVEELHEHGWQLSAPFVAQYLLTHAHSQAMHRNDLSNFESTQIKQQIRELSNEMNALVPVLARIGQGPATSSAGAADATSATTLFAHLRSGRSFAELEEAICASIQ